MHFAGIYLMFVTCCGGFSITELVTVDESGKYQAYAYKNSLWLFL